LSVYNEIRQLLPNLHYIYAFDNVAFPYGEKSRQRQGITLLDSSDDFHNALNDKLLALLAIGEGNVIETIPPVPSPCLPCVKSSPSPLLAWCRRSSPPPA
jgi:hypothetical protein